MWHMNEGMGWWMVFGGIVSILFWAGIIALVVWVIAKLAGSGGSEKSSGGRQNPLDIARERYARGDITRQQLEEMKKDLT